MRRHLGSIEELLEAIQENEENDLIFCDIGALPLSQTTFIRERFGIQLEGFFHIFDNYAFKHILVRHGDPQTEGKHGQIAVQWEDFLLIPLIVFECDVLEYEFARNKHVLIYKKVLAERLYVYVAEIRSPKRKMICGQSFRIIKKKAP